jgi:hypothetical protein
LTYLLWRSVRQLEETVKAADRVEARVLECGTGAPRVGVVIRSLTPQGRESHVTVGTDEAKFTRLQFVSQRADDEAWWFSKVRKSSSSFSMILVVPRRQYEATGVRLGRLAR